MNNILTIKNITPLSKTKWRLVFMLSDLHWQLYTSYLSSILKESKYNGSDVELTPTFKQLINFYLK